jgi:hypothetical protein
MSDNRSEGWSRREFLTKATLAGAAGIFGVKPNSIAAEPPPETTRLKILDLPRGICLRPSMSPRSYSVARGLLSCDTFRSKPRLSGYALWLPARPTCS